MPDVIFDLHRAMFGDNPPLYRRVNRRPPDAHPHLPQNHYGLRLRPPVIDDHIIRPDLFPRIETYTDISLREVRGETVVVPGVDADTLDRYGEFNHTTERFPAPPPPPLDTFFWVNICWDILVLDILVTIFVVKSLTKIELSCLGQGGLVNDKDPLLLCLVAGIAGIFFYYYLLWCIILLGIPYAAVTIVDFSKWLLMHLIQWSIFLFVLFVGLPGILPVYIVSFTLDFLYYKCTESVVWTIFSTQIQAKDFRLRRLTQRVEDISDESVELRNRNSELMDENRHLNSRLLESESRNNELELDCKDLEDCRKFEQNQAKVANERAEQERDRADAEWKRAEQEKERAEQEQERAKVALAFATEQEELAKGYARVAQDTRDETMKEQLESFQMYEKDIDNLVDSRNKLKNKLKEKDAQIQGLGAQIQVLEAQVRELQQESAALKAAKESSAACAAGDDFEHGIGNMAHHLDV